MIHIKQKFENILSKSKIDDKIKIIYDLNQLKENISKLNVIREKYNIQFLFPVKAFPNTKILTIFSKFNFGFDITNYNEYNLIKNLISDDTLISFNGYSITKMLPKGTVFYTCQSLSQNNEYYNSIRINTNSINKKDFSRFGVSLSNLDKIDTEKFISLNIHYFSNNKYNDIKKILKLINKALINCKNIKYINLGGNWDINNLNEFEKIVNYFKKNISKDIKLIFEVGENWFKDCGYLVTKVLDINYIDNKKIITILGSKECNAKWSQLKLIYPESVKHTKISSISNISNIFVGNTCYEKDVLYFTKNNLDINIGDKLIFSELNGYSFAWITSFNGIELPEVSFYE